MDPINTLQVAIKNNIDVFYYACPITINVLFSDDGQMDKRLFLSTWKEIPSSNEVCSVCLRVASRLLFQLHVIDGLKISITCN